MGRGRQSTVDDSKLKERDKKEKKKKKKKR